MEKAQEFHMELAEEKKRKLPEKVKQRKSKKQKLLDPWWLPSLCQWDMELARKITPEKDFEMRGSRYPNGLGITNLWAIKQGKKRESACPILQEYSRGCMSYMSLWFIFILWEKNWDEKKLTLRSKFFGWKELGFHDGAAYTRRIYIYIYIYSLYGCSCLVLLLVDYWIMWNIAQPVMVNSDGRVLGGYRWYYTSTHSRLVAIVY